MPATAGTTSCTTTSPSATPRRQIPRCSKASLNGVATVTLRATQDLQSLNFDLRGLDVTSVQVDGKDSAEWSQEQDDANRIWELTIGLQPKLKAGQKTTIVIEYGGTTGRPLDTTGALYGWVTTADGAMVVNEPEGAATWYPVNDDPEDKATYTFRITVPEGKTAVANGLPVRPAGDEGRVDDVDVEGVGPDGQLPVDGGRR